MKKTTQLNLARTLLIFTSTFLLSKVSFAYLSLAETAELLNEGQYRIGVAPQLLLNGGGSNVGVFFDMPVQNDINSRITIGSGDTDFWASGSLKWIPYPDYKKQPAIGVRGAVLYARDRNEDFYDLQVSPIISKLSDTKWGKMNPYIGLPVTYVFNKNHSYSALQFAVGTEWVDRPDFQLGAELDLNLSNTASTITLYINFPFDGNMGFRR